MHSDRIVPVDDICFYRNAKLESKLVSSSAVQKSTFTAAMFVFVCCYWSRQFLRSSLSVNQGRGSGWVPLQFILGWKLDSLDRTLFPLESDHSAYQSFRTHGRFVPRRFVPRLGRFVPNFQSVRTQPSGRFVPNEL